MNQNQNVVLVTLSKPVDPDGAASPESLPEFERYQPSTGDPNWPRLMAQARREAAALSPRLEKPQRGMTRRIHQLLAWRTLARNYLTNRKLAKQGREDLRPLYFIWTMLRTCNFACTYCDDHRGRKYPELPNEGVLDTEQGIRLLQIMRTRTPSVYFAGGEPTVRQDLPALTRAARDLAYYPIIINTNASLIGRNLGKESWRTWLADTDIIIVSLDALNLNTLERMWAYRRPRDVLRNLLLLRELASEMSFKLMINTVIQPGRIDDARAVLDFACDMKIWFCPVPMNVGPAAHQELLRDPAYRELARTILARKREGERISGSLGMNERLLFSEPLECRNTLKPHIDYDGRLAWPCKACVNVEPKSINVLDFDDVDTLYEHATKIIDPTGFHGPGPDQCGANCNWAHNYTTDLYARGLSRTASLLEAIGEFLDGN